MQSTRRRDSPCYNISRGFCNYVAEIYNVIRCEFDPREANVADTSKEVDKYIRNAPEYAQPILEKIRKAFHKGCPGVEEAIKWGVPYFMYNGMLGGMAAFKQHVGFGFWKTKELDDPEKLFESGTGAKQSMCTARVHNLKELPTQKVLVDYVKRAAKLNDTDSTTPKTASRTTRKKIVVKTPPDLATLLKKNKRAKATYDALAPSHKRDYVQWITEAKRDATRQKRLATTIEWLAEGKRRNWKYERC